MEKRKKCIECGYPNKLHHKYCVKCGRVLPEGKDYSVVQTCGCLLVLIIIILLGFISGGYFS